MQYYILKHKATNKYYRGDEKDPVTPKRVLNERNYYVYCKEVAEQALANMFDNSAYELVAE